MKKKVFIIVALILILTALTFAGCDNDGGEGQEPSPTPTPTPTPSISVSAKQESVSIHEKRFEDFNFTSLFIVSVDGEEILVQTSYLDLSGLPQSVGDTGTVTCTYKDKSASCFVTITPAVYTVELSTQEISITQLQVDDGFDFLAFFSIYEDDEKQQITSDMVQNGVKRDVGTYDYTVTYNGISKTLKVNVTEAHLLEVVNSYRVLQIEESELASLNPCDLFSLYVDGESVSVTSDMVDASALDGATVGNTYEVKFAYEYRTESIEKSAYVKIVAPKVISLTSKNVVTYPNSAPIDVTSLFTIKDGDENVAVTMDMIEGEIDYTQEGINLITLTYKGENAVAQIEVKRGVVINKPNGDYIVIKKGTNKNEYNFANDIQVIVNGLKFSFVTYGNDAKYHIDTTNVNFDELGTCTANVSISYGVQTSKVTVTDTITYVVNDMTYEASVVEDEIVLAKGTTSYNVLRNFLVKVNGIKRTLTEDKEIAKTDKLAVWAQVINGIDFTSVALQNIKVAVYPQGVDSEPVYLEYTVSIKSGITITSTGKIAFAGDTVYTKDLFAIKDGNEDIKVTADMLEGKVNTFAAGVYTVKMYYLGLEASANVVVLSDDVIGTYKTNMTTIPSASSTSTSTSVEDEWGSGYGDSSDSVNDDDAKPVYPLSNMTIKRDGSITLNGLKATVQDAINENTIIVKTSRGVNYTLHFDNGIVVADPDNSLRMAFHDDKRPMVYFNSKMWNLKSRIVVNSNESYILSTKTAGYSFDVFKAENSSDGSTMWYALRVELTTAGSSDTVYSVEWGEASLPDDFTPKAGATSTLTYDGVEYDFKMSTSLTSKVVEKDAQLKYAGKTFKGSADGSTNARLYADSKENFRLTVDGVTVFDMGTFDLQGMKNGGIDYDTDTVFLYKYKENKFYSYKFVLDVENNTFECIEKDYLIGYYECGNRYIFLDGYGTGMAKLKDDTSYTEVRLTYEKKANEIRVKFIDVPYDFECDEQASFYLATFGNVLTVKQLSGLEGMEFVNSQISSGAIITLGETAFVAGNSFSTSFLKGLTIVTKDGVLSDTAKKNCVDTSKVAYGTAGFYNVGITLEYAGESIVAQYAVQILNKALYTNDNKWVFNYGNGTLNSAFSLNIEKTGVMTLDCGEQYTGFVNLDGEDAICAVLQNANGDKLNISARFIIDGTLLVRGTGALSFNEYFTKGTKDSVGGTGAVIRKFVYNDVTTYMFSTSFNSTITMLETFDTLEGDDMQNGSIILFDANDKQYIVKIIEWGNTTKGLAVSDKYRGVYTKEGADKLCIDGFGSLTLGLQDGTYSINENGSLYIEIGEDAWVVDVDFSTMTYADSKIKLDNTLVLGKTFSASYNFTCENSSDSYAIYKAVTKFEFLVDGKVRVTSTSEEHDSGDDACSADTYNPTFASANGKMGTYSVKGKTVTVTVGNETIEFELNDVSLVLNITCVSTTVEDTAHGYFAIGTQFSIK